MVFNVVYMIAGGFLLLGMVLQLRQGLRGGWHGPRKFFNQNRSLWFPALLLGLPLLIALIGGRAFHTRYCVLLLAPLFVLAGAAAAHWQQNGKFGTVATTLIIATIAANVWFVPAMYHHQGWVIENGEAFVPSFRQMEKVYQILKADAGDGRKIEVSDTAYLQALGKVAGLRRDAILLHRYVAIREQDSGDEIGQRQVAKYVLTLKTTESASMGNAVYDAHGIVLRRAGEKSQ
jgi:hypothetical protein